MAHTTRVRQWLGALVVLTLSSALAGRVRAASEDYLVDVWDAETGLPSSSVTSLAQTPDGYLWIGTHNGLVRFDGVRFTVFDPATTPAIAHARVDELWVDETGRLWLNTHDGSLTSLQDGAFAREWQGDGGAAAGVWRLPTGTGEVAFLVEKGWVIRRPAAAAAGSAWTRLQPAGAVLSSVACRDAAGALWIRSTDERLWRLQGGHIEAIEWRAGLVGRGIQHLACDDRGRVWIASERELAVWNGRRFTSAMPGNGPATGDVTFLLFSRSGDGWAVVDGRARRFRGRRWLAQPEAARGLTGFPRLSLDGFEDRVGGIWFAHFGKGLVHVRPDGSSRRITVSEGLPGERIDNWLEDREGNIWLAVDRGGLVRLRERRFQVLGTAAGLSSRVAASVCEDAQGSIWIGTLGGGLDRWRDGRLSHYRLAPTTSGGSVFSVVPDRRGRLWLSADREDLLLFEQGRFMRPPVAAHGVKAILIDKRDRVWLGLKDGLAWLDHGQLRRAGSGQGLAGHDVRALAEAADGALWAGAGDGALYRISGETLTTHRPGDGVAAAAIWSLLADADGAVWAGTFRGGLLRLKDGRFTRFTTRAGLPSDVISQLLDDGRGYLWVGSDRGIFSVAKASLEAVARGAAVSARCVVYGRSDGLPTLELPGNYQPAAWAGRDGRLWFTTTKGVVSLQPREMAESAQPPPVVLEDVFVTAADGERVLLAAERAPGTGRDPLVVVQPGYKSVQFQFTGLALTAPERVRFRYRLEPLEAEWVEAGTRRWAQYSYLRPGDYRFRVEASNGDGVWGARGAALKLTIQPRFWEARWFLVLVGLAAVGAIAGTARYVATARLRRELVRMDRQRAIEGDRARIAKDIHDDLGAGLTQITLLSELARSEPPVEAESHLAQISQTARELTLAMDEIVWAVNPQNDTLDSLTDYVCKFAHEYLTVAGIQCRFDVPAQLPALPLRAEVRHNLFLAVKEALHNVVKHAHAREVWLRLSTRARAFTLAIEDDGLGFEAGSAAAGTANGRLSSGLGLDNLDKRLRAIGGTCLVESQPGRGTRVAFEVALP